MSSSPVSIHAPATGNRLLALSSTRFDGLMTLLSGWLVAGLYLDGWAHTHGRADASFFTPWHAVFYGGFSVIAGIFGYIIARNRLQNFHYLDGLPQGYLSALIGVLVFALGGIGDALWHTLFGAEQDIEALLSPTHLLLAFGMVLIMCSPIQASRHRSAEPRGWKEWLVLFCSLAFLLSLFAFFTQFAHPWILPVAATSMRPTTTQLLFYRQALGIVSMVLQMISIVALVVWLAHRYRLPPITFGLIFAIYNLFLSFLGDQYWLIAVGVLAGLAIDLCRWLVDRVVPQSIRPYALAAIAPTILAGGYFCGLLLYAGTWWSVHLVGGTVVAVGLLGVTLSIVLAPRPKGNNQ
jgi:hypothetical protein